MKRRCLPFVCAGLLLFPLLGGAARACLNDRDSDSLAHEAKGLPDVVRVVTGRFERNPPLFYQMRIERVRQELALVPSQLDLYDDVAVAYDRLGKDDDAIAWIEKKRARLGSTVWQTAPPELREAWYRYYANVGTFRVHRWLRAGAARTKIAEVVQARDEIALAVQIRPDAHFNRERYQLAAMNWIINPYVKPKSTDINPYPFWAYLRLPAERKNMTLQSEGLTGLIVLGNAWESPDITGALADTLRQQKKSKVAYLAYLRCRELLETGHASLIPAKQDMSLLLQTVTPTYGEFRITNPANVEAKYRELRREANDWQKHRTAFMMARLKEGRHPDTDVAFWRGFHDTAPPPLDVDWSREWRGNFANYLNRLIPLILATIVLVAISGSAILWIVTVWRIHAAQKRLQRPTSRPE